MAELLVWHFLPADGRVACEGTPVAAGQTLTLPSGRPLKLCSWGYHGSVRAIDALRYAPGPVVQRALLQGEILQESDSACATRRTCIAVADASRVLWGFACWCAERALQRKRAAGREPDARSWAAVEARRAWLRGEITDAELAAAARAAYAAFEVAVHLDGREYAYATHADAAWVAAAHTAYDAHAAGAHVAYVAADAAEREAQNVELEARLRELLGVTVSGSRMRSI